MYNMYNIVTICLTLLVILISFEIYIGRCCRYYIMLTYVTISFTLISMELTQSTLTILWLGINSKTVCKFRSDVVGINCDRMPLWAFANIL